MVERHDRDTGIGGRARAGLVKKIPDRQKRINHNLVKRLENQSADTIHLNLSRDHP